MVPVFRAKMHFLNFFKKPVLNPLKTEGILRIFQKVIELTQKWKDLKNNGST
jgi:hypothetical protein